ncbi:MAG: type II secretion system protein [Planctomycetota bacterium]
MTEPRRDPSGENGFTLLEVLVALGIMTLSLTALLGALSLAVGTRRGAEMRARAVLLAESVLQQVEQTWLAEHPVPEDWQDAKDLVIPPVERSPSPDYPGMQQSVSFVVSPDRPDMVLVKVVVVWRDDGEDDGETFVRILPRAVPLARRVAQRRTS